MSVSIFVTEIYATSIVVSLTGITGDDVQMQISIRPDFEWCVCPTFLLNPVEYHGLPGLNQNTGYYARARNVESGVPEATWGPVQWFRTAAFGVEQPATPPGIIIDPALIVRPAPLMDLSAHNEQAGFPASNLLYPAPTAWKSFDATYLHRLVFSVVDGPIDVIALLQTNLPEDSAITVRGDDDRTNTLADGTATFVQAFDQARASQHLPGRPGYHALLNLATPRLYRWWCVDISCMTPGAIFHAEHLVAGLNLKTKNHALDKKESPVNLGSFERTRAGLPDRNRGIKMRRHEFDLAMLTEDQYERTYSQLWRETGETMLVVPNSRPGSWRHDRIAYGDFIAGSVSQNTSVRYTRGFAIESLI